MSLINRLDARSADFDAALTHLLAYDASQDERIESTVRDILRDVQSRGDAAVLDYTARFDQVQASRLADLEIPLAECRAALAALPADQRAALESAAERVRRYHERQRAETWTYTEPDGTMLGQQITPLDSVGLYVPGGKAAYPSSVLMNAIPAKVAGVPQLIMVTPTPGGTHNPMVLAAAALGGVDRIFAIGGAQAVGALAYGTQTLPAVDKIVGPGNAYVAAAKRRVFGTVGIDMIAGPSEILILADGSTPADWLAIDLFFPSRTRRTRPGHLAVPGCRLPGRRIRRHRTATAKPATRRHPARQPGQSRCADPNQQPRTGLRTRQPHRPRTPGNLHPKPAGPTPAHPPCRGDFPGRLQLRIPGRLLRRTESRPAHRPHSTLFIAVGRV